jgi:hypothetical protein
MHLAKNSELSHAARITKNRLAHGELHTLRFC